MNGKYGLPILLLIVGTFITFVHDYAYRRTGGSDFEVGGLISHAGADMLIVTIGLSVAAYMWLKVNKQ